MLGSVESDIADGRIVVADFEAGIGTMTRMHPGDVDAVLVLVEPTAKSIEVAKRAAGLARDKHLGRVVVVANRIREESDLEIIREALGDHDIVAVPDDPAVIRAEREGLAPLDHDPDAPAVAALRGLADDLVGGAHQPAPA